MGCNAHRILCDKSMSARDSLRVVFPSTSCQHPSGGVFFLPWVFSLPQGCLFCRGDVVPSVGVFPLLVRCFCDLRFCAWDLSCKHLASRFSLLYRYDSVLLSAGAWAVHWVAFHWVSRYVVVLFFFFPCFFSSFFLDRKSVV